MNLFFPLFFINKIEDYIDSISQVSGVNHYELYTLNAHQ